MTRRSIIRTSVIFLIFVLLGINQLLLGEKQEAEISKMGNKEGLHAVNNVILVAGFNTPQALLSCTLAQKINAPIVMVANTVEDSSEALKYLQDYLAPEGQIYLIGNTSEIPFDFIQELNFMGFSDFRIHRLGYLNELRIVQVLAQSSKIKIPRSTPTYLLQNASKPVSTPTYEGSGEAVHPSVIDFKTEYNMSEWNGFRYWMACTPYPNGNFAHENPSLLASNDGQNWVIPSGIINPIVNRPGHKRNTFKKNYNSDPELIYDSDNNCLILFWRESMKDTYDRILRQRIYLNLTFDVPELCIEERGAGIKGVALSPTIWRKSNDEWYMWTTNGSSIIYFYFSKDGTTWSKRQCCNTPWNTWNGGYTPWHIEAKPNYREQRVEFFIDGWSKHSYPNNHVLFYAEVPMDDLTNFRMPLKSAILDKGLDNAWDGGYIYRTAFTIEADLSGYKYHVWYSAESKPVSRISTWHIGYTEGKLNTKFTLDKVK